jgi:hypothetical protein
LLQPAGGISGRKDEADSSYLERLEKDKSMEARIMRVALLAAVLSGSMGAQYRTPNFIVETRDAELAAEIGRAAEEYRRDLAVEWLGKSMPKWWQPCVMTVRVGPNLGACGATTFVFDQGEVFGWRMTIQGSHERLLDSVLPHEITHMIFASHFRQPVPRWADEGAASSVEHASERAKHQKMLYRFLCTGRGIAFNEMFAMKQYPRDIMPLYAQGHSLATYLIQLGGRRKFVEFVGDGMSSDDWSAAIQRHYGISGAGALQKTWLAWVRNGSPLLDTPRTQPATAIDGQMLAAAGRRARPEPNLIYHIRAEQPAPYAPGSVIPARPSSFSRPRSTASELPDSGWYAAGTQAKAPATAVAAAAPPAVEQPHASGVRSEVTHPQAFEQFQQIEVEPRRWPGQPIQYAPQAVPYVPAGIIQYAPQGMPMSCSPGG